MSRKFTRLMLASVLVFASSLCVAQEVVASIPTGGEVLGFAIDLPGHRVYAAVLTLEDTGPSSTYLYIIDTQTRKLIKSVAIDNTSPGVATNPVTHRAYATACGFNLPFCFVTVFNSEGSELASISIPPGSGTIGGVSGIVADPLNNRIYVGDTSGNELTVIDGATNKVGADIPFGQDAPTQLALDPLRNRLYVLTEEGRLDVIDTNDNKFLRQGEERGFAGNLDVDPLRSKIYIGGNGNVIDVVSTVDFHVLDRIDLPFAPGFIVVDSSADEIFASSFYSSKVAVIDGRTEKVEEEVKKAMNAIEVDPVARVLYAGGPISSINGIETEPIDVIKGVVFVF
jgi:YVTN family beta-propeller protein